MDGSPSVLEETVYSNNQRVEVLLTEGLSGSVAPDDFRLINSAGDEVSDISITLVSQNPTGTLVFELSGPSSTDIRIERLDNNLMGLVSNMPMGVVTEVATIRAYDSTVPRITSARLATTNTQVILEFSHDVYAVSTDDFVLELLNADIVTSIEVASLTHPAAATSTDQPSTSVVVLDLRAVAGNSPDMSQGNEFLRIRLKRDYFGDIAALYEPGTAPKRAATHQIETDMLPMANPDAPSLESVALNADNTELTLTFDRDIEYVGTDEATDFTFDVITGANEIGNITEVSATFDSTTVRTIVLGLTTVPAGNMSVAGQDRVRLTVRPGSVENTDGMSLSAAAASETFTFNDTVAPALARIITTSTAPVLAADNSYTLEWGVEFTEPVNGVGTSDFSVCRVDNAGDPCGATVTAPTSVAGSGSSYRVTAAGLAQASGTIYYRLRFNAATANTGITEVSATNRPIDDTMDVTSVAQGVDDTIGPQEVSGGHGVAGDNTTIVVAFDELITIADASGITVTLDTGSAWVTGVTRGAVTAVGSTSTAMIAITTAGPSPLNGASADGGEMVSVMIPAGAIEDTTGNASANRITLTLELNENAAPQVRDGDAEFMLVGNAEPGADAGTVDLAWRIRFTETVRNVSTANFSLLEVNPADGTSTVYTVATYATDTFAPDSTATFSVTIDNSAGSVVNGALADTYRITTRGLQQRNASNEVISFALRLATAESAEDDESRALAGLGRTTPVHQAITDMDAPELVSASLNETNTMLTLTFNEPVTYQGTDAGTEFTLAGVSNLESRGVQWITGASVTTAAQGSTPTAIVLSITTTGPGPLNGDSPEGGEEWRVTIAAPATIIDIADNTASAGSATFTFNENAAPQVRDGGFTAVATEARIDSTDGLSELTWQVHFTEPVRDIDAADFTLLSDGSEYAGTGYNAADDISVAPATNAESFTRNSVTYYDRYNIAVVDLAGSVGNDAANAAATYVLRLNSGATAMDGDGRPLAGLFDLSDVQEAPRDITAPELVGVSLDPTNATLTLTFNETVSYEGTDASMEFTFTERVGTRWITAVSATTAERATTSAISVSIITAGPAPLGGFSPEGGESWRVTIADPAAIVDVGRNPVASGTRFEDFTFNDNIGPYLRSVTGMDPSQLTAGQLVNVAWTITFTEPVSGVDAAYFRIYRLPAVDSALSAESNSPTIGSLSPVVAGSGAVYTLTVTIPEPVGTDAYYTVSLADVNNVMEDESPNRVVPEAGRTAPRADTSVATVRDISAPRILSVTATDSLQRVFTYTFDEEVLVDGRSNNIVSYVTEFNAAGGAVAINPAFTGINPEYIDSRAVLMRDYRINVADFNLNRNNARQVSVIVGDNNNTVRIPAPDYLRITLPAGLVGDRITARTNPTVAEDVRIISLTDSTTPELVRVSATSITRIGETAEYTAVWAVEFSEPVEGVDGSDFSICSVATAMATCSDSNVVTATTVEVTPRRTSQFERSVMNNDNFLLYAVSGNVPHVTGGTFYRLRLNASSGIQEFFTGDNVDNDPLSTVALPFTGDAQEAPDVIGPQVDAGTLPTITTDNRVITITFDEALTNLMMDNVSVSLSTTSEWVNSVARGAVSIDGTMLTINVTPNGEAPLRGDSADGGEQFTVTIAAGAVRDAADNSNVEITRSVTLNENAAPQIRNDGFTADGSILNRDDGTTNVMWQIRFTETVRDVDIQDFVLLSVTADQDASASTSQPYAGSEYSRAADMTVTSVSGALSTIADGETHYDTYLIRVTGLDATVTETTIPARYALRLDDSASITDDDNKSMAAANLPAYSAVQVAEPDVTPPTFDSASLDPTNNQLTLTFSESVSYDTAGGTLTEDFRINVSGGDSNHRSVLTAMVTSATAGPARNLVLTIDTDGPAPLNGLSAVGGEMGRITINRMRITDVGNNPVSATTTMRGFEFSDNTGPYLESISDGTVSTVPAGDPVMITWTMEFTEPVVRVDADGRDFRIYRLPAADSALDAPGVSSPPNIMPSVTGSGFEYTLTLTILEPVGGDAYYKASLADGNDITDAGGRGVPSAGRVAEQGATTVQDRSGPMVMGTPIVSTGNASIIVVFNEALGSVNDNLLGVIHDTSPSSEWITSVTKGTATIDGTRLVVPITPGGSLNGLSPNGGEGITLTVPAGALTDGISGPGRTANGNELITVRVTLRETAAPQIRSGGITGVSGQVMEVGLDRTADLTWTVRFTESVSGVTSDSFTLLRVMGTDAAETRTTDTTTSITVMPTTTGEHAEQYMVVTNVDAGDPGTPARYVLAFGDTTVMDDDGRPWSGDQFQSGIISVDDRVPPVVVNSGIMAVAGANAGEIRITLPFNEDLSTASILSISNSLGRITSRLLNPDDAYVTVRTARLTSLETATTAPARELVFIAALTGTLDNGESAVGNERFEFDIPAGFLVDNSPNNNPTTVTTSFEITVPESGAPEVRRFVSVSATSINTSPVPGGGLFDLTYEVEFTEPVDDVNSNRFVLYQVSDRQEALRTSTSVETAFTPAPTMQTAAATVQPMGPTTYRVSYAGVQRPPANVRGYVLFLDSAPDGITDQGSDNRPLEDCRYSGGSTTGCLSTSANVSDIDPPGFATRQAQIATGQSTLWLTFNEPVSVPGGQDGQALGGFRVNRLLPTGEEVVVSRALYRATTQVNGSHSVEVQLAEGITTPMVWVTYEPPGTGFAIHDNALALGLNGAANRLVSAGPMRLTAGTAGDEDNDGVPDFVEAGIGANPYAIAENDPRAQNLPQISIAGDRVDGDGMTAIAYSGIRDDRGNSRGEAAIMEHLGVSVTPTGTMMSPVAYYRSGCTDSDLFTGACREVDFPDDYLPAATSTTIVWLATNENGYPQTQNQFIYRVPEVNMDRVRQPVSPSNSAEVTARVDDENVPSGLTLGVTSSLVFSESARTRIDTHFSSNRVMHSAIPSSRVYTITRLERSGGGGENFLWLPASSSSILSVGHYSRGPSSQTRVIALSDDDLRNLRPSFGEAKLALPEGSVRGNVTLVARNASNITVAPVSDGVRSIVSSLPVNVNNDEATFEFMLNSTSTAVVSFTVTAFGVASNSIRSTTTLAWPLRGIRAFEDNDSDGIPALFDADGLTGGDSNNALPVATTPDGRSTVTDDRNRLRALLPQHFVSLGSLAIARTTSRTPTRYGDFAASSTPEELQELIAAGLVAVAPPSAVDMAYDFTVRGVDPILPPGNTFNGGQATIIISLPPGVRVVSLYKYRDGSWGNAILESDSDNDLQWEPLRGNHLRVTIRDGGDYDSDGEVNGVIEDPLGVDWVAEDGVVPGPGRKSGGGSFGPFELLLILFAATALVARNRRRRALDA